MTKERFEEIMDIYYKLNDYVTISNMLKYCTDLSCEISKCGERVAYHLDKEILPMIETYYTNKVEEYKKLMDKA